MATLQAWHTVLSSANVFSTYWQCNICSSNFHFKKYENSKFYAHREGEINKSSKKKWGNEAVKWESGIASFPMICTLATLNLFWKISDRLWKRVGQVYKAVEKKKKSKRERSLLVGRIRCLHLQWRKTCINIFLTCVLWHSKTISWFLL